MFYVKAGNNKFGFIACPTCGKLPEEDDNFYFVDKLSAKEYTISGMCQECQDSVFQEPESDEEYYDAF